MSHVCVYVLVPVYVCVCVRGARTHFDLSDSIFRFDHFYAVDKARNRNRLPQRGETSFIFEKHDTRKHGYELLSPLDFI